jgi:hypothetical protein
VTAVHLTLQLHFDAPYRRLLSDLARGLERVTLALDGLSRAAEMPRELRTSGQTGSPNLQITPRALDVVKPETTRWLIASAFRDWVEDIAGYFEQLRQLDAVMGLSDRETFTEEDLRAAVDAPARAFDKLQFHEKVARLTAQDLLGAHATHILSINAARNCLVHRRGFVGDRDVAASADRTLRVTWISLRLAARSPDGAVRDVVPGMILEGGTDIIARTIPVERVYREGEAIDFSTGDLVEIWWTIDQFARQAHDLVIAKARRLGFTFSDGFVEGEASK